MAHRTGPKTLPRGSPGPRVAQAALGRWTAAGIAGLAVLLVLAVGLFVKLQSTPAPLVLSAAGASGTGRT